MKVWNDFFSLCARSATRYRQNNVTLIKMMMMLMMMSFESELPSFYESRESCLASSHIV
jgi:hypothetical protein